jgi:hypothetical protein
VDSKTCPATVGIYASCEYTLQNCSCSWDSVKSECEAKVEIAKKDPSCLGAPTKIGTCEYGENVTGDSCDDGILTYSWIANWVWDPLNPGMVDPGAESESCISGGRSILCPAQISLPFFNEFSFVLSLIVIIFLYFFLKKKKYI